LTITLSKQACNKEGPIQNRPFLTGSLLMNQMIQRIPLLVIPVAYCAVQATVVPYLAFRSQGFNAARELVGWQTTINRSCAEGFYGSFSATPEYTRSYKANAITRYLYADALIDGNNSCKSPVIKIEGTKATNRDPRALMAENFYLPTDFKSKVSIHPRIENFLVDLNLYLGLDNFLEGLYFRIHTPICHTRWALNFCEHQVEYGTNSYDVGYFDDHFHPADIEDPNVSGLTRSALLQSFEQYICYGASLQDVGSCKYQGLACARISKKALTVTRPAEITAALGWNFWTGERYHCGAQFRVAVPTGNRPSGCWLFEPIVGNGHHWELGGGLTGHWRWWANQDLTQECATYIDINATTLFSTRQYRTFDLCAKPLSRYMLALRYTGNVRNLWADTDLGNEIPLAQFDNTLIPVANITTIPVDVSIPLHIDAVVKCSYAYHNWQFDLGYNLWWRACERICTRFDCCSKNNFMDNTYALKGDAFIYGFEGTETQGTIVATQPGIPLSASQHKATIFSGTNGYTSNPEAWNQNNGIDLPHDAYSGQNRRLYTHTLNTYTDNTHTRALVTPTKTSYTQPIFINTCDVNIDGAKTNGLSNKIFAHISYNWLTHACINPYFGCGAEVELGKQDTAFKPHARCRECSCCPTIGLSQWGVWVKAGCAFNS
jgi:hypothetical protein